MASLKRWIGFVLLACVALALAYLPPRGAGSSDARSFQAQAPQQTAARSRAQALAEVWRAADGAVRLLSMRRELQQTARPLGIGGISLALVADSAGVPIPTPALVDSAGRVAWRQLGLGETKVKVVLITQFATGAGIHEPETQFGGATSCLRNR